MQSTMLDQELFICVLLTAVSTFLLQDLLYGVNERDPFPRQLLYLLIQFLPFPIKLAVGKMYLLLLPT